MYLTERMDGKHKLEWRRIYFDQLHTLLTLLIWLLNENHAICIGTLIVNKKGIPRIVNRV